MARRDEFSPKTIRTIALRAGYLCTNPDCRHPTSGPHSEPDQAIVTGEAAHICAAAEGGPRFNPNQTSEQRKHITNAIWLCGNCNKKIDTDWKAWPEERLQEMKATHEKWIAAEAMIPSLPVITLTTHSALHFSRNLPEITADMQEKYREHELVIENPNRVDFFNIKLELNLPEAVMGESNSNVPIGCDVRIRSVQPSSRVQLTGDASASQGRPIATVHHLLEAHKLGAGERIVTGFYTAKPEMTMAYDLVRLNPDLGHENPEKMEEHKICHFYLRGTYQFVLRNEYVTGNVFVPLLFKADSRTITSYSAQASREPWKIWTGFVMRGAALRVGPGGAAVITS